MNATLKQTKRTPAEAAKAVIRDASLFAIGGGGYYLMEVVCRGYSHWSMAICGGTCLFAIFHSNRKMKGKSLITRAAVGAGIITAVEFICGCIVNLALDWRVWDYSHLPMNLFGQICFPFSLLWFGLCIPICAILGRACRQRESQNSR
ncbi:MAG: hypothetical protein IJV72_05990 [Clostridia bacterium]|nr:hypothetical protein [Clostridia bacterium]